MNKKLPPFAKAQAGINFKSSTLERKNLRLYAIPIALFFMFLLFFGRLFHLTVVKGNYYGHLAENNRIHEILIEGERGTIYDRKGHKLAYSTELTRTSEETPTEFKRIYNDGEYYAHMLGYRQIASDTFIEQDACSEPLRLNDKVGAKGVEKLFECHLRPIKGKQLIEVDVRGKYVQTLSMVDPRRGNDIKLGLDAELQQYLYEQIQANAIKTNVEMDFSDKKISVVGINPRNGEVVVLFSYPSFNPQVFEDGASEETAKYLKDKDQPLFNRALVGTYPPGSVFKMVIAAGALEESVLSPTDTIVDEGFIQAGPSRFHNWYYTQYGRTEGEVDLVKSLQRSNDIYYYKAGEKLTPEGIKTWAHNFGFGKRTGIALDDSAGLIPSAFWKEETINEPWYLGDTYNMSIGQGYLLTTPLQIAMMTSAFANDGKICKPQVLKYGAEENEEILNDKPECTSIGLDEETVSVIREGMKKACEAGGTAWPFFDFRPTMISSSESAKIEADAVDEDGLEESASAEAELAQKTSVGDRIPVGCKTGTAESFGEGYQPHAWFTVFAPFDDPEIVLTVLVEEAGEGSSVAAPIAKTVLDYYFSRTE